MLDMHSLAERFFYTNRRSYSVEKGGIAYLDSTPLRRPFAMPLAQKIIMLVVVAVACGIGFMFINDTILDSIRQAEQTEQTIASNLKRQPSVETIPQMTQVVNLSDDEIRSMLADAGYGVYDASATSEDGNMILYKLPSDVSVEEAGVLYAQGINALSPEQATKLLVGSWRFDSDRVNGTSMAVHYADFSTGDPQVAVRTALEAEGLDPNSVSESGVDDSGNTYSMGTVDVDGVMCSWKISAIKLDEIYSVSGVPTDACYVGVRITVQ